MSIFCSRQYIDRQIEAARVKIEEKTDKQKAYYLRRLEVYKSNIKFSLNVFHFSYIKAVYGQKARDFELSNHRGLVRV